jgi:hypothetical protein
VTNGNDTARWDQRPQASAGEADGDGGNDTLIGGHVGPYVLNGGSGDDTGFADHTGDRVTGVETVDAGT